MLSSVSWSEYATALLVLTTLYYLCVWIIVFKGRVPALGHALRYGHDGGVGESRKGVEAEDAPDEMITTAQHVIEELRPLFRRGIEKSELLFSLRQKLSKYSEWDEPGFRETLNPHITRQAGTICSIRLSEDDTSALWK